MNPKELGKKAEDLAVEYLKKKNYKILGRNVRYTIGEIDIVAEKEKVLTFVEVKAGSLDRDFNPMVHYDRKKQMKQIQLAQIYLNRSRLKDGKFDLILVQKNGEEFSIDHFENVIEDANL